MRGGGRRARNLSRTTADSTVAEIRIIRPGAGHTAAPKPAPNPHDKREQLLQVARHSVGIWWAREDLNLGPTVAFENAM